MSISQAKAALLNRAYGPNAYTSWGKATITSWTTHYYSCVDHRQYYTPNLAMKQYPNPTRAYDRSTSSPGDPSICAPPPGMVPDSWYNPFSWDWGHIFGATWNAIWNNCLKGAAVGDLGKVSLDLAMKLLIRGGKLVVDPAGYAAVAFSGCIVGLAS